VGLYECAEGRWPCGRAGPGRTSTTSSASSAHGPVTTQARHRPAERP